MTEIRPWGSFRVIDETSNFKVKVITVLPHSRISYQSHEHREEHWIVVIGDGYVICDEEVEGWTRKVKVGDYVFIPKRAKHRIVNNRDNALQIVEVQLGTYFGEDDIIRYEDDYGRCS